MTFEKIKNELKLFFSYNQLKDDYNVLVSDFDSILKSVGVTNKQIEQLNLIWDKNSKHSFRFIVKFASILFISSYILKLIIQLV